MKSQSILLACAGVLITAGGAHAQDVAPLPQPGYSAADPYVPRDSAPVPPAERSAYAWDEPYLASGIGVGLVVGGGVMGFTDRTMRDTMSESLGGLWDARMSLGTHVPIGLDVSYVGTAASAQSFQGVPNGTLIGTTVEGALRFNLLPHMAWNPYFFAGAGWTRYDVSDMRLAQADSGMRNSDDVAEFPLGGGLSFRDISGMTAELRGTFRPTTKSTLVVDPRTGNAADLHTWEASASIGYEF